MLCAIDYDIADAETAAKKPCGAEFISPLDQTNATIPFTTNVQTQLPRLLSWRA